MKTVRIAASASGSSLRRMLGVIDAFTEAAPVRTVDDIAGAFGYTRATTYRYVSELCEAGLLARVAHGAYSLGPRIIELDRQIQRSDPLLGAAEAVWPLLLEPDRGQVALLCGLFRDEVLCIGQAGSNRRMALSYARGRPMPLFRGATAKAILAWLPERRLTRLYAENQAEIRKAGLGQSREAFLAALKAIRRQGHAMTFGEVDRGVVGIAVPVFGGERSALGSLSVVFPAGRFPRADVDQVVGRLSEATRKIRTQLLELAH